ncbi:hypothetical protein AB0C69_39570 [Actinomadura sp. NPDC048032]|uniref:hypothetical protein n=1 Tax=Actinomadura sp. NPDC048032 TaxID=3155747 RepID=UPI0033F18286
MPSWASANPAGVAGGAGRRQALGVQVERPGGVAAQLGDEPQLGQEEGQAGRPLDRAAPVEPAPQDRLGLGQAPAPARREGEADLGEVLHPAVRLADGQPPAALVQVVGAVEVAFEQRDAAEAGEAAGRLRPEPELLGVTQAALVQVPRAGVVAGHLREQAERLGGLEAAPPVARRAEQPQGPLAVAAGPGEVTGRQRLPGPHGERRRLAPLVSPGAEPVERAGRELVDRLQVPEPAADEPEEPARPRVAVGGEGLAHPLVAVGAVAVQQGEPGVPGPRPRGGRRVRRARHGERPLERPARLAGAAPQEPGPAHRVDQPQRASGVARPDGAVEGGPQVAGLRAQPPQGVALPGTA